MPATSVTAAPSANTQPDSDVLARIREQTRDAHRALERRAPFFHDELDAARYIDWLRLMGAFHARVEQGLDSVGLEAATGWRHRRRSPLVDLDLRTLGAPPRPPLGMGDGFDGLDWPNTLAGWVGALYVVEGSALGGRVILKQVTRVLGWTAEHGAAFFAPHGDATGAVWADCLGLLRSVGRDAAAADQVVAGAVATFGALDQAAARWEAL